MVSGYEVKMYGDISRIAMALDSIADSLQRIAEQGDRNPYFHEEDAVQVPPVESEPRIVDERFDWTKGADGETASGEKGTHDERPAHRARPD